MQIGSEQSDPEIVEHAALRRINSRLAELTANLMRVARGAGKPYELEKQTGALFEAFERYRGAVGHGVPSDDLACRLRVRKDLFDRELSDRDYELDAADEAMVAGALQVAASRLAGQRTQERRGESDMHEAAGMRARAIMANRQAIDHSARKAARLE